MIPLSKFDMNATSLIPGVARYVLTIAELVISKQGKQWLEENSNKKQEFLHSVFSQAITCITCIAKPSRDMMVMSTILRENISNVSQRQYQLAQKFLRIPSTSSGLFFS